MRGAECDPVAIFLRSVPQIPQVCTRRRSSPAPIWGTATVSTRTSPTPRYTAACMVVGIAFVRFGVKSPVTMIKYSISLCARCQPLAKRLRGDGAIPRQLPYADPQPWSQRDVRQETERLKRSVRRYEAGNRRQPVVARIRDHFAGPELDSVRLGAPGNGSRFHIHHISTVGLGQAGLLIGVSHFPKTHQNALPGARVGTAAIASINHQARSQRVTGAESRIKTSCETRRNNQCGLV